MKITHQISYPSFLIKENTKKISFKTNESSYTSECDKFVSNTIKTNTYAFRGDLLWDELALQMNTTFKNKDKVNVYSLACSDGSEPYSLAVTLMEELKILKTDPAKFFPILASDRNEELIKKNKKGLWNLKKTDFYKFEEYRYDYNKYITESEEKISYENDKIAFQTDTYKLKPELKNKVKFSHADIIERLKTIDDDSNTVILCRNVLPYLMSHDKVIEIAKLAGEKLKKGSLFVIGDFDSKTGIRTYLEHNGFALISEDECVFQKKTST